MSFLRYALSDVIRSRRRTFSSILGVILAVTFIAGTLIAIDSSTRATLDALLSTRPGDFFADGQMEDPGLLASDLRAVPGVERAIPFAHLHDATLGAWGEERTTHASGFGIDPSNLPGSLGDLTLLAGSMELPRGSVVLSDFVATFLGVGPSDVVFLTPDPFAPPEDLPPPVNLTVEGVIAIAQEPGVFFGPFFGRPDFLVHILDAAWVRSQLGIPFPPFAFVEIWIDRDRFVDPYDLQGSREQIVRLERQLSGVAGQYGATINNNLLPALSNFEVSLTFQRVFFLMLSAPVILLGLYLGAVGVDLGHAERRRELAVLKARGAGRREVMGLLLLEALIGGIVATLAGLLGGVLLSRLLLGLTNPMVLGVTPRYEDFVLAPGTILVVFLLSVLFMGLVSYRSAKRTAGLPIVETLRYYAPGETRIGYRPTLDIVFVTVAVATYGVVLYAQASPGGFFLFVFAIIFFILTPVAPILLIIGATRLLTRSTGRVYKAASRAVRPFARNLSHVISRNLARNPRRSSNISVIIALGIGFGLFVLVLLASTLAAQAANLRAQIGADMAVTGPVDDPTFGINVSTIPRVVAVGRAMDLPVEPNICCAQAFALEPEAFFAATQPEAWQLSPMSRDAALSVLSSKGRVLVSGGYANDAFLRVGDRLRLAWEQFDPSAGQPVLTQVNVTVGGIVRGLPALGFFGFSPPRALYGNFETFEGFFDAQGQFIGDFFVSPTFFVDLEAGAPVGEIKSAILGLGAVDARVYEEELERGFAAPTQQGLAGFIGMEVAFVVVILTAGLGLIIYAASLERDVEFAAISARGSSGWQTAAVLLGEGMSIMLVGILVGAGIGLLTGYVTLQIFLVGPPGVMTQEQFVPFPFVVPPEAVLLLAAAPLAMLATILLISWHLARMNIARVLKQRGG